MKKKKGYIKLKKQDAAIVLGKKDCELVIPNHREEDKMPNHVITICLIASMIGNNDSDVYELLDKKYEFYMKNIEEKTKTMVH